MPIHMGELTLYSTLELSQSMNVSIVTLRSYLKEGKLKGRKFGGRWYISDNNLREFFGESYKPEKTSRISLQGVTDESMVTDKDIEDAKKIWT